MNTKQTDFELDKEFLTDFPYVKHFKYASIYSIDELEDWEFRDNSGQFDRFKEYDLPKGRIGVLECECDKINTIVVIKENTKFYGYDDDMTTDSVNYFLVDDNKHYCAAQEPCDVIGDVDDLEIEQIEVDKYNLDHLLTTN